MTKINGEIDCFGYSFRLEFITVRKSRQETEATSQSATKRRERNGRREEGKKRGKERERRTNKWIPCLGAVPPTVGWSFYINKGNEGSYLKDISWSRQILLESFFPGDTILQ